MARRLPSLKMSLVNPCIHTQALSSLASLARSISMSDLDVSKYPCMTFHSAKHDVAGDVGIDDALVLSANEEVIEMMNGCLCCTGNHTYVYKVINPSS